MRKSLILKLILVLLFTVSPLCFIAYLGFIPGLSNLFGANKPKELGITWNKGDFQSYMTKAKAIESKPLSGSLLPEQSMAFEGTNKVIDKFTDNGATAVLNMAKWRYMPLTNNQVKFNKDGSLELSATLRTDRLSGFIEAVGGQGFTNDQITQGLDILNKMAPNPAVYVKATPVVKESVLDVKISSIQIGRLNIPLERINADESFSAIGTFIMKKIPGFYAKSVTFGEGIMNFEGYVPQQIYVVTDPAN